VILEFEILISVSS